MRAKIPRHALGCPPYLLTHNGPLPTLLQIFPADTTSRMTTWHRLPRGNVLSLCAIQKYICLSQCIPQYYREDLIVLEGPGGIGMSADTSTLPVVPFRATFRLL